MIDILFLAHNRKAFTEACLANLIANTNWKEVARIVVYDDNSTDGTREFLENAQYPVAVDFRSGEFKSPVAVMVNYLRRDPAEMFAKIDSDTMVPAAWLESCLRIMHLHPRLDLLGIEAFRPVAAGLRDDRTFDHATFIGGIGLMRSIAFQNSLPRPDGRQGFTQWQEREKTVEKAWLNPALPVFLLDWLPREPWRSLTLEYVKNGWNRDWSGIFPDQCPYPEERKDLWDWWCE